MRARESTGVLESWYSRIGIEEIQAILGDDLDLNGRAKKKIAEAHKQTHEHVFHKLTTPSRGLPRIVDQPPLLYHVDQLEGIRASESTIAAFFQQYRETLAEERRVLFDRFKLVDFALKVVGVGSVGTRCLVALLLAAPDDALFLQVKEAGPSVLERYTGTGRWSITANALSWGSA